MPSPLGHGLAGVTAGWLVDGSPRRAVWTDRRTLLFALIALVPDLDLLFGAHSGPTHGLGAALLAGLAVWVVARLRGVRGARALAIACALAYASHTLLDWLGTDSSPPIGIMALWPVSRAYFESSVHLFPAISRRYWLPEAFWLPNLHAVLWEVIILAPVAIIVRLVRRRLAP